MSDIYSGFGVDDDALESANGAAENNTNNFNFNSKLKIATSMTGALKSYQHILQKMIKEQVGPENYPTPLNEGDFFFYKGKEEPDADDFVEIKYLTLPPKIKMYVVMHSGVFEAWKTEGSQKIVSEKEEVLFDPKHKFYHDRPEWEAFQEKHVKEFGEKMLKISNNVLAYIPAQEGLPEEAVGFCEVYFKHSVSKEFKDFIGCASGWKPVEVNVFKDRVKPKTGSSFLWFKIASKTVGEAVNPAEIGWSEEEFKTAVSLFTPSEKEEDEEDTDE